MLGGKGYKAIFGLPNIGFSGILLYCIGGYYLISLFIVGNYGSYGKLGSPPIPCIPGYYCCYYIMPKLTLFY